MTAVMDDDDYEFHTGKLPHRLYLSRLIDAKLYRKLEDGEIQEIVRPLRILSEVMDCSETHQFIRDGKEISLRITDGGRQEVKATFYEDSRNIRTLQIQRFTKQNGVPHKISFSFSSNEISTLYNFLRTVEFLPIKDNQKARFDNESVKDFVLTREQAVQLLSQQPDLIHELAQNAITPKDIAVLGYRRKELSEFELLLFDEAHFENRQNGGSAENVWQSFFERNTWIFGYGLNYCLNAPLDGEKLEKAIKGYGFTASGKRVDALLKTRGLISALSFGEIKTHKTFLLKQLAHPYRNESWQISDELAGGIAQVQKSVQASLNIINERTDLKDSSGKPTGETVFLYQPKSFIVVGSLAEFQTPNGVNEDKYSSFELFRRNTISPEIITFDELYSRAKFIVESDSAPP